MMKKTVVVAIVSILAAGALVFGAGDEAPEAPAAPEAPVLEMKIYADNWSWSPNTIRAKKGTRVILTIENRDSPHSFVLKAYRLKVALPQDKTTTVEFIADKAGTFVWKCGRPCGNGCPKMRGTLTVLDPEAAGS
ncbi:MAG: cupredoxin domain-containing protein [Acidobacteria bacterium]|uniref:Cupredoxin domain-containing protein n=1 Tax=Candidatus Polarisedimenticola svalbardensis TaxID=2886004 RepID=A0A8J7CJR9_9BACT|nr:cupredoxin domain-containing protein [Candidatus Polarisedimenticola svalbardensis]